ncbi:MAG TPA: NADPH-dependent FMN reductase [Gemmatimonadaceae bacterium]|nr:NADPH-dependent FMN reductase [Gemmatimonadaceae bacterium]
MPHSPNDIIVNVMKILAISGSLRALSSNTALLRVAAEVAPEGVIVTMYDGLATLPQFNPDDDVDAPPPSVLALRAQVGEADGLLLCSPEYAHGVPGSLKNAFDWLVRSLEFPFKPVALLNASPWAMHAHASLIETLGVMNARIVSEACATIPVGRADVGPSGEITNDEIREATRQAVERFVGEIGEKR